MKNALMLQHDKIMLRKKSLIETVNDQLKDVCQIEFDPLSMLPKLHHQSVIGFGCFLFLRQKALHQQRRGVCTFLFPAGCLGRIRVFLRCLRRINWPSITTANSPRHRKSYNARYKLVHAKTYACHINRFRDQL